MSRILYYLVIKPVSLLPLRISYLISNSLYWILYKMMGYRKKVVFQNIQNSFPEKNEAELKGIMDRFYRHFCDIIIEVIRGFSMKDQEYLERVTDLNEGYLDQYYEAGRSVVITAGHYGNWEWIATAAARRLKHRTIVIFSPLKDKFLDAKIKDSRGQLGLELVSKKECQFLFENASKDPIALIFANDQSPSSAFRAHWTKFLNQDTPVVFGAEKYAKAFNAPLIYAELHKLSRGKYAYKWETLMENPKDSQAGEVSEAHTRRLELDILKEPAYWLWTHKRWKKTLPEGYGLYPIVNTIKSNG